LKRRVFIATGAISFLALFSRGAYAKMKASGIETTVVSNPDGIKTRLTEEAKRIFQKNRVDSRLGSFHLPSFRSYKRFYAWDSGWNIISQTAFDPESAVSELEAIFNFQVESGRVPHEAVPPEMPLKEDSTFKRLGYDLFDENGMSYMLDPPSFLIAAGELYDCTGDPRIVALLPKMEKCLDYLIKDRDLFGNGLITAIHRWEPGTDMAPSYDEVMGINPWDPVAMLKTDLVGNATVRTYSSFDWDLDKIKEKNDFLLEDPGLNAIAAGGALAVSNIFEKAGDTAKAGHWLTKAKDIVKAMENYLWNERTGFFYPRYDVQDPKLCGRASLTGLVPLMTGLVSEDKAMRIIDEYLTSPKHFWAPWLVPFNSVSEMRKDPPTLHRLHLWRGSCIWINMNWMVARSAKAYGREDIAREITRRTALMIDNHGFREYYRPGTGKGVGAMNFTWPALVLPMIEEHGL